jgi:hypothetical protein
MESCLEGVSCSLPVISIFFSLRLSQRKNQGLARSGIKRRRIESPRFYNSVAFAFDFIAIVFGVVAKISG